MRPARIYLGTPIRTYKCIYKGQLNTGKLPVHLHCRPAHSTSPPSRTYICTYKRPANPTNPAPRSGPPVSRSAQLVSPTCKYILCAPVKVKEAIVKEA
jgi:hypothetical protein